MTNKIHNFSAGPGILPAEVMKKASEAVIEFNNSGLSLLEMSHRSKDFVAVMEEARSLSKELLGVGDNYQALFLGGGASLQFAMVPYNLLPENGKAAYINSGVWASKAIKEAKFFGSTEVIASSEDKNFNYVPSIGSVPEDAAYLHITSNNTIYGTQLQEFPTAKIPVVCDMSSDIFSRKVDGNNFALIYAGAQKNMGPAGSTLVIVREDILDRVSRKIPSMLDYKVHIKGESMYNTPPVFPVYVSLLTMQWLKKNGGIEWIEKLNNEKAAMLYSEIDRNSLFKGTARTDSRSKMNVTFVLENESLDEDFNALAKEANLSGLKGHRSVGGYRASIYNALPIESVKALIEVMQELEKKKG